MDDALLDLNSSSRERLAGQVGELAQLLRDDHGITDARLSVRRQPDGSTNVGLTVRLPAS